MKNEKLGQEPAFAKQYQAGMSKRFYAACAAMQGMISNVGSYGTDSDIELIRLSYRFADELLKQEDTNNE
jgi:hypothetical protein